ncbi:MAG: hypothetical protein IKE75_00400 [Bacilli bacterium]|nr:hypothetical protein [Bacilli bacterium]
MFDEKRKTKIVRRIKKELREYPDYNPDLKDLYQRTDKYEAILPEVFWNIYGEPNFTNREMRKLDLSCISFEDEIVEGIDFSHTNVNLDPTKVRDKSIDYANFTDVDLSSYSLDGVSAIEANLTNSNVKVDFDKIRRFSKRTKFKGCYVLESSTSNISYSMIKDAYIVDIFEKGKVKTLTK